MPSAVCTNDILHPFKKGDYFKGISAGTSPFIRDLSETEFCLVTSHWKEEINGFRVEHSSSRWKKRVIKSNFLRVSLPFCCGFLRLSATRPTALLLIAGHEAKLIGLLPQADEASLVSIQLIKFHANLIDTDHKKDPEWYYSY